MSVYRTYEAMELSPADDSDSDESRRIYNKHNADNGGICRNNSRREPSEAADRPGIQIIEHIMNALNEYSRTKRK